MTVRGPTIANHSLEMFKFFSYIKSVEAWKYLRFM